MQKIENNHRRNNSSTLLEVQPVNLKIHQNIVYNNIKQAKKDYGIFFTPEYIVDFMVNLIDKNEYDNKKEAVILEPACGLAQFLTGIKRNRPTLFNKANLYGVEINKKMIDYLKTINNEDKIRLINTDYLLWQSGSIFDLIIGNPPYGIPSLSNHYSIKTDDHTKAKYRNLYETWYGKYNVYGAFVEKSIKLLKPEGHLIFIVPPTFMILDEFKKLRAFLSENGRLAIFYLGPDVFKPDADVASVVLDFHKNKKLCYNLKLLEYDNAKIIAIKTEDNWRGKVIRFETDYSHKLENLCSYLLGDIYEISISPRTPEIKNNSHIVREKPTYPRSYLPLLNGRNLKCNKIIYDNFTGYWVKKTALRKLRKYFHIPHIVVGLGFREDGRVAAAYEEKCYPWMGDIYHLLKKEDLFNSGFDLSNLEIIEYLNSDYIKKYVEDIYREITYHLSITQLKSFPLPAKREWEEIKKIKL